MESDTGLIVLKATVVPSGYPRRPLSILLVERVKRIQMAYNMANVTVIHKNPCKSRVRPRPSI